MTLNNSETIDLLDRFDYVAKKYVPLAAEIAPKLEQFGKYKRELEAIVVELKSRGVEPQDSEELTQIIEEELKKRGQELDEQIQTDIQRLTEP